MRSIWRGHIKFSLVTIPIQIFNAVEKKHDVSFKQLHNKDHGSIGYSKVCKSCNEEVPYGDIVKGYEYEPDQFVVIHPDELKKMRLKSTRTIEIEAFVDIHEVHPSRFEAVYFVGPHGDIAHDTFNLLVKALAKSQKAGVGRIVLRDREDVVLLVPEGKGMIMYKLRYPYELRELKDVPDLKEVAVKEEQMQLAETLIDSLSMSFENISFEDHYRDAVLELVQNKIDGKEIVQLEEAEDAKPVVDIMAALKASIDEAKKKKS